MRELLQEAGERSPIPASDLALIRAAARQNWEASRRDLEGPGGSRIYRRFLAMAAVLVLVVMVAWMWREMLSSSAASVAVVEAVADGDPVLAPGARIPAGFRLETPAPMALRLAGGQSLRVDSDSVVELLSATRIRLARGAVYVDSGAEADDEAVSIETAYGVIQEIGTQFEVRFGASQRPLIVRVREGRVSLSTPADSTSAAAGEQLVLRQNGSVRRGLAPVHGDAWLWVERLAPSFEMEGSSLEQYFGWLTRETGWSVEIEDAELRERSTRIILHGSLEGLSPRQTVDVVLVGSGLSHDLDGGRLLVSEE